jgi:PGF-CTERM protein
MGGWEMKWFRKIMCVLLAVALLSPVTLVSAEVVWADEITDRQGDVEDDLGNPVSGHEDIDIVRVRVAEEVDDLNVTLTLADAYNTTAIYNVDLEVDGSDIYRFEWTSWAGFKATDPSGGHFVQLQGGLSSNGKELYWVVWKSDIPAQTALNIYCATSIAYLPGAGYVTDTAVPEIPPVETDIVPKSISIVVDFVTVSRMRITMSAVYEGENATSMRTLFDIDADGKVSASEVTTYMVTVNGPLDTVDSEVNITLDGAEPMSVEMSFSETGAEGDVNRAEQFKITFLEIIQFPEPDNEGTHTYGFEGAEEFVGGDEPWDNEFVGGDEPWDNEFIGDDPWDDKVGLFFAFNAPDGWQFNTNNWPAGLGDFLNPEGTAIEMDGMEVRRSYNSTFGSLDTIVIDAIEVDVVPKSLEFAVLMEDIHIMRYTISADYEGESAAFMRGLLDANADGTVTATEVSDYLDEINGPLAVVDTEVNITLDDMMPKSVEMSFSVEGAEGDVSGGQTIRIIFMETITFPIPAPKYTHTYGFEGAEEFVGGDEPWENEFVGGDEPWENEFVGGDEPWENRVNTTFQLVVPERYEFNTANWPSGLINFVDSTGSKIEMDGPQVRSSYNSTFGSLDALLIDDHVLDIFPKSIYIVIDFEKKHVIRYSMSADYEGESAAFMRGLLDEDADGTVTAAEVSDYLDEINGPLAVIDTEVNITFDDMEPSNVAMGFSVEGAGGDVSSGQTVKIIFEEIITFPLPTPKDTHTYTFVGSEEFVGGDEPWENEYIGGDEPWENEFIGGDEPWENRINTTFQAVAPDGWQLNSLGWPLGLEDYVNPMYTIIEMDGPQFRQSYNSTFGSLEFLMIDLGHVDFIPEDISVLVDYEKVNLRNTTVTVVYAGDDATRIRLMFDVDSDGNVNESEVGSYINAVNDFLDRGTIEVKSTLDDKNPSSVEMEFDLDGADGPVTSINKITFTMVQTVNFPEPEDKGSHVYGFEEAVGGDEPWDNEFIGDDPWDDEFIGDDPWDNVFVGGVDPWDGEFVGGDEPWDNKLNVEFRVEAPEGWKFKKKDWPAGLEDFLGSDDTKLSMDPLQTRASYSTTMGKLESLTIEEQTADDGDDGPGFGFVLVVVAVASAALVARRRRWR